jgi:hypothetical protein
LDFLKSFVALAASKHDGYHVGSTLQDLHIVESLVGRENVIKLAFEYNDKIVILFLMVCFE